MDGHNDLPWRIREDTVHPHDVEAYDLRKRTPGMTDLARIKAGHLGAQFWSIYIPGEPTDGAYKSKGAVASTPGYARVQMEQFDIARRVIEKYPELKWALTADAVRANFKTGTVGSLLGLEGGHAIENSLALLRQYYDLGARYMTLTHNVTLDWADAALDAPKHNGLTPFGTRSRARDEPTRHARRSVARVAGHDELRARRHRSAGDLLALRLARARRPSRATFPTRFSLACRRTAAW